MTSVERRCSPSHEDERVERPCEQPRWFDLPTVRPRATGVPPRVVRISARTLARYEGLADVPVADWASYFPNAGVPWNAADRAYLIAWWGKDAILSLAYALGRPPWVLQREVSRLRKTGVAIAYQRDEVHRY